MIEMRPEFALEWLRLMREIGGHHMVERLGEDFFEHAMHPRELMRMIEMRPEVAIEWLRIVRELDDSRWYQRLTKNFRHEIDSDHAALLMTKGQDTALALIRVLRLCREGSFLQHIQSVNEEFSFLPAHRGFDITKIPLDYVVDLQWYATVTGDAELLRDIEHHTSWIK